MCDVKCYIITDQENPKVSHRGKTVVQVPRDAQMSDCEQMLEVFAHTAAAKGANMMGRQRIT